MLRNYDPSAVEAKWQKKWEEAKLHEVDLKKAKDPFYSLVMFPYPSGDKLHVGHWYNYAPADSYARFKRMQGHDVLSPMGFDAFGLPAENYAIKTGVHPAESTKKNVQTMITQLKKIGCMYDWSKMVNTTDPSYYRWTQWLFLQMYKNELAYQKEGNVNWCPSCQTVLANEQAQEGVCERCGTEVIQKSLKQWFWNIKKYAQRLLDGLDHLDWPNKTKLMQRNWIGRSEGAEIMFDVAGVTRGVIGWEGLKPHTLSSNRGLKAAVNQTTPSPTISAATSSPAMSSSATSPTTSSHDEAERQVNRGLQPAGNGIPPSPSGLQPARRTVHLTIEPHNREPLFSDSKIALSFLRIMHTVSLRHDIMIHEICAMPDHVHLLISFEQSRHLERDVMQKLKGGCAHDFNERFSRKGSLWARGGHFEEIGSEEQFRSVLYYIEQNPKKAGIDHHGRLLSQLPLMVNVFTTRHDTLFGATYLVLAPEHPLVDTITTNDRKTAMEKYRKEVEKKTELQRTDLAKTKTGEFTGAYAINPATKEKIPVWIADYVLLRYGTGSIMAVPGHDERDHAFAKKFDLPMKEVLKGGDISKEAFTGDGVIVNSDFLDGLTVEAAKKKMILWLENEKIGKEVVQYRLRDWLVSRQRYWGAPIPIVYDPEGNPHPVPEDQLPWLLPTDVEFKPTGKSPLTYSKEFIQRTEKIFGKGWRPEFDTMDTFVCSSFYYLRYLMPEDKKQVTSNKKQIAGDFVDPTLEKKWLPVSMYIGGPEHACMHLIYARFVMMALKDFGVVSHDEPFQKLVHQGLITNKGAKMSKSKGNVVSPDSFIDRHGSDVFRMYLMFMGPFTDGGDWSDTGIKGIDRFVQRLWTILTTNKSNNKLEQNSSLESGLHSIIKKISNDVERLHFNTVIAALMEFLNMLEKQESIPLEVAQTIAKLIAPLAPHLADELWAELGGKGFIVDQEWPKFDPKKIVQKSFMIAVQVNGKVRGDVEVAADASKEEILAAAKEHENVKKYLEGHPLKKEIYVEGKLVSLVI